MRPVCWRLLTRCGVHTMLSVLGTAVKLGGAIKHLTLVGVSFGIGVWFLVLRLGVPMALWCTGSLFAMDFSFVPKNKNKIPK